LYAQLHIAYCIYTKVDSDIRLRGHNMWRILREGQFNMYPSISCLYLRWRGEPKSIVKLDYGHGRICYPWIRHCIYYVY